MRHAREEGRRTIKTYTSRSAHCQRCNWKVSPVQLLIVQEQLLQKWSRRGSEIVRLETKVFRVEPRKAFAIAQRQLLVLVGVLETDRYPPQKKNGTVSQKQRAMFKKWAVEMSGQTQTTETTSQREN